MSETATEGKAWRRAKQLEGGEVKFMKTSEMNAGDAFEGVYVSSSIGAKFGKEEYKIETEDGLNLVFNEGGNLKSQMAEVNIGDIVRIEYGGKKPLPKSHKFAGTPSHQYTVLVLES